MTKACINNFQIHYIKLKRWGFFYFLLTFCALVLPYIPPGFHGTDPRRSSPVYWYAGRVNWSTLQYAGRVN